MSRSRRKLPVTGTTTACSEKKDKRMAHRVARATLRDRLHAVRKGYYDPDAVVYPNLRDVSDVWSFSKDGKTFWGRNDRELMAVVMSWPFVDGDPALARKAFRKIVGK